MIFNDHEEMQMLKKIRIDPSLSAPKRQTDIKNKIRKSVRL